MLAVARGRWNGSALVETKDIFTADPGVNGPARMVFGRDGMLYVTTGGVAGTVAQDANSLAGKVLRLKDDGTVPPDNPFVGKAGYRGEIYAMGIRNAMGLAIHPQTGELWETENGPQGGDELNIIRAGKNYG
jgi:glucose/arabinose dehydrogenase